MRGSQSLATSLILGENEMNKLKKLNHYNILYDVLTILPITIIWLMTLNIIEVGLILLSLYFVKKDYAKSKKDFALILSLSVLIVFGETIGKELRPMIFEKINIKFTEFALILFKSVSLSLVIEPILNFLISRAKVNDTINKFSIKKLLIYWFIILIGYIPCILGFYPGLLAYDAELQWSMMAETEFTTHHPIIHTLLIHLSVYLSKATGHHNDYIMLFYNMIQVPIVTFCIGFGIAYLDKLNVNKYVKYSILIYYIVLPIYAMLTISSTKDVLFGSLFLLSSIILLEALRTKEIKLFKMSLAFTLMNLFRNNSMYALIIFGIILTLTIKRETKFKLKLISACIISTILSIGINKTLQYTLDIKDGNIREMLSIPSQQIARTYCYNSYKESWSDEDLKEIDKIYPSIEMLGYYNVLIADPIKNYIMLDSPKESYSMKEVIKEYISLGLKYPKDYILAYVLQNIGLWYSDEKTSHVVETVNRIPFSNEYVVNSQIKSKVINKYYSWFQLNTVYDKLPILRRLFYAGTYNILTLICLFVMIIKRQKRYVWLPILIFSYLFTVSLGPCVYTRYIFNIMLIVPILIGVTFRGLKEDVGVL